MHTLIICIGQACCAVLCCVAKLAAQIHSLSVYALASSWALRMVTLAVGAALQSLAALDLYPGACGLQWLGGVQWMQVCYVLYLCLIVVNVRVTNQ